jgi:hypothetical protein
LNRSRQPRRTARSDIHGWTPFAPSDRKSMFEPYPKYQNTMHLLGLETLSNSATRLGLFRLIYPRTKNFAADTDNDRPGSNLDG